jgi:hypothetical protein
MQWRVPICTSTAVISISAREPLEIGPNLPICVFGTDCALPRGSPDRVCCPVRAGATLQTFKSTGYDSAASILNIARATFWIVDRADMLSRDLRDWFAGVPNLL